MKRPEIERRTSPSGNLIDTDRADSSAQFIANSRSMTEGLRIERDNNELDYEKGSNFEHLVWNMIQFFKKKLSFLFLEPELDSKKYQNYQS